MRELSYRSGLSPGKSKTGFHFLFLRILLQSYVTLLFNKLQKRAQKQRAQLTEISLGVNCEPSARIFFFFSLFKPSFYQDTPLMLNINLHLPYARERFTLNGYSTFFFSLFTQILVVLSCCFQKMCIRFQLGNIRMLIPVNYFHFYVDLPKKKHM